MVKKKVVAVIAGTGAAVAVGLSGYGLLKPASAPSGMEQQILKGEQVGSATRAKPHAPLAVPVARPAMSAAPAAVPVRGGQVTAIGDSVMAASTMALAAELPGIYIDAKPSRQWAAGLDVVRGLAASGQLRPVVVIGLGTNYIVTTSQLNELLRLLGPDRKLVLINTFVPDTWSQQVNATEAAFVRRHPAIILADWFDLIRTQTYLLWPDRIHPQIAGTKVYAGLVYRAVQATRGAALAVSSR